MRANHHDLVGFVGAGNLSDDVETVRPRFIGELRVDVQLDRHADVVIEQPDHAVVVLDRERDLRNARGAITRPVARSCNEDGPSVRALLHPERSLPPAERSLAGPRSKSASTPSSR